MTNRLKIIDYFEWLIDQVDIKAESLLKCIPDDEDNDNRLKNDIEHRRSSFIDECKRLKEHNLNNLNVSSDDEQSLFSKYCLIFDKFDMNMKAYTKNQLAADKSQTSDFDYHRFKLRIEQTFGYLIVLDGYLDETKLYMFKKLLACGMFDSVSEEDENIVSFKRKSESSPNQCQPLNEKDQSDERQIFDFIIPRKGENYEEKLQRFITVKFGIFEQASDFIIETNERELFRAVSITFDGIFLKGIRQKPLELFFAGPLTVELKQYRLENTDCVELMRQVRLLQTRLVDIRSFRITIECISRRTSVDLASLAGIINLHEIKFENGHCDSLNFFVVGQHPDVKTLSICSSETARLDQDALQGLPNLQTVNLERLNLAIIDPAAFSNLANLAELYLLGNRLTHVHESLFKDQVNLRRLDISSNRIDQIHPSSFDSLKNLTHLDLSNNFIPAIEQATFNELSNLETLSLAYNKIETIQPDAFSGLVRLKRLDLADNRLTAIDQTWFSNKLYLQILDLSTNNFALPNVNTFASLCNLNDLILSYLEGVPIGGIDSFVYTSRLNYLDMESVGLEYLPDDCFNGLDVLVNLNVSRNMIGKIDAGAFNGLSNLECLNLNGNLITQLKEGTLEPLVKLKLLNISQNNLTSIERGMFEAQTELDTLKLDENNIGHVALGSFETLVNLKELSMEKNKLIRLKDGTFTGLERLRKLSLRENGIKKLNKHSFDGLGNLRDLNLAENNLDQVDDDAFCDLKYLRYLRIKADEMSQFAASCNHENLVQLEIVYLDSGEP